MERKFQVADIVTHNETGERLKIIEVLGYSSNEGFFYSSSNGSKYSYITEAEATLTASISAAPPEDPTQ